MWVIFSSNIIFFCIQMWMEIGKNLQNPTILAVFLTTTINLQQISLSQHFSHLSSSDCLAKNRLKWHQYTGFRGDFYVFRPSTTEPTQPTKKLLYIFIQFFFHFISVKKCSIDFFFSMKTLTNTLNQQVELKKKRTKLKARK
jgi:hypothetical protein